MQLWLVARLIPGYWSTAKQLTNMEIAQHELRPRCKLAEETSLHVLIDCEPLLELGKDILGVDTGVNTNIMEMGERRLLHFAMTADLNSSSLK